MEPQFKPFQQKNTIKPDKSKLKRILITTLIALTISAIILFIADIILLNSVNEQVRLIMRDGELVVSTNEQLEGFYSFIKIIFIINLVALILNIILLIIFSIYCPRKIQYTGNIETEEITNFNNIKLTKNNVYSLFNIKVKIFQDNFQKRYAICKIKIKPQFKHYNYFSNSITLKINNEYTQTIFLNSKGRGKCKFPIYTNRDNESYEVIDLKGSMIFQN